MGEYEELMELMKKTTALIGKVDEKLDGERRKLYEEMKAAARAHLEGQLATPQKLKEFRARYEKLAGEKSVETETGRKHLLHALQSGQDVRVRLVSGYVVIENEQIRGQDVQVRPVSSTGGKKVDLGNIPRPSKEDVAKIECGIPPGIGKYDSKRDGRIHGGTDIYAEKGTALYASHAGIGIVLFSGDFGEKEGNVAIVIGKDDRGEVVITSYSHCESVSVAQGQAVQGYEAGKVPDSIAKVGDTGTAKESGPHVHFVIARAMLIEEDAGGKKKRRNLNAAETKKLFEDLSAMDEPARKEYLAKIRPVHSSMTDNPESFIRQGVIASPIRDLGKIGYTEHCNYYKQPKQKLALH